MKKTYDEELDKLIKKLLDPCVDFETARLAALKLYEMHEQLSLYEAEEYNRQMF